MNSVWDKIQMELAMSQEPLSKVFKEKYIDGNNFDSTICLLLADKLGNQIIDTKDLASIFRKVLIKNQKLVQVFENDIDSYFDRDFACENYFEILFFFRGYHALSAYRFSHLLYRDNKKMMAKWLQSRMLEIFSVDIHPAAKIGNGLVIDHAISIVIGETAIIEDNVFMFHNVTLGGTGKHGGLRHPKICSNVVIGAGAKILGNITIRENSNIAAGSVVLNDVPKNITVAGVPAKQKGIANKIQ